MTSPTARPQQQQQPQPSVNQSIQSLVSNSTNWAAQAEPQLQPQLQQQQQQSQPAADPAFIPVIAIHGGASASSATPSEYRRALNHVLLVGQQLLQEGHSCVDVACECVRLLEEIPIFNAGKGSVYNCDGEHELDASCMRGCDLQGGSVAATRILRNPILAAKRLLERGNTVLLAGRGADLYGQANQCCEVVPNSFFDTQARKAQHAETQRLAISVVTAETHEEVVDDGQRAAIAQARSSGGADQQPLSSRQVAPPTMEATNTRGTAPPPPPPASANVSNISTGTVGAVVLDTNGDLAAATSSGGLTNKPVGRVADTGIIGAGTYAANQWAAVSCAGSGEVLIRCAAAYSVIARMRFGREPFFSACDETIFEDLAAMGGVGGLIAVDPSGNVAMPFNSTAMPRGFVQVQGEPRVAVVREPLRTLQELEPQQQQQPGGADE